MSSSSVVGGSDTFECSSYSYDSTEGRIELSYRCGEHMFSEKIMLHIDRLADYDETSLDHALQLLHLTAGVSYFKSFIATVNKINIGYDTPQSVRDYMLSTYEKGLGELLYKNSLSPHLNLSFTTPAADAVYDTFKPITAGIPLLGLGGGKDSLVAVELLRLLGVMPATFGVNGGDILLKQAELLQTNHLSVQRVVDVAALQNITHSDGSPTINGHVPISAILACTGLVGAILTGCSDVVVAVERSADEPTVADYQGVSINHQWSKSSAFEQLFDETIQLYVHPQMRFYSLLRPLRELDIMRLYFGLGLAEKFKYSASSCNLSLNWTAGRQQGDKLWDGTCDKCCFMYLLMSGVGQNAYAVEIMGRDLFAAPEHTDVFLSLLGVTDHKPFDCVGEISEAREAMNVAKLQITSAQRFVYPPADGESVLWSNIYRIPPAISAPLETLVKQQLFEQR